MTRAFALTGAGLPMRSWGLPSERVAATGVAEVEAALGGWPARRRVLLGDAPARFEAWLQELDAGGHPYLVALPVRALKAAGHPVLKHPGRYRVIDPGLRAKEVRLKTDGTRRYIVGEGRPPGRHPADRAPHGGDHAGAPAGAEAPDSGRCGGAHTAAVGTAAGASGLTPKFVIATNDPAIALDRAVGVYRAARMMDARLCRRPAALSETDVATDPTALKRLTGEMKLEMLAFQLQRAAELRCGEEWAAIAAKLSRLQAVRYRASATTFVQRTAMTTELAELFTKLRISQPPKILHLDRLVASAGSP